MISLLELLMLENVKIDKIKSHDIPEIADVASRIFDGDPNWIDGYFKKTVDWNVSYVVKTIEHNTVVGFYLLKPKNLPITPYNTQKGIQGVSLGLLPEYRNQGVGDKLRRIPFSLPYDYIWGFQGYELNNVSNWTKFGRKIVYKGAINSITVMPLKGEKAPSPIFI